MKKILQLLELIEHNQRRIIQQQVEIQEQLTFMYQEWYEGHTKEKEELTWLNRLNKGS